MKKSIAVLSSSAVSSGGSRSLSAVAAVARKTGTLFAITGALLATVGSALAAGQFTDVSVAAGINRSETRAWGNPVWGDLNGDGFLDLIVPVHELAYLGGPPTPFVYINNKDGTFTDIATASGLTGEGVPDNKDWLGISLGDYNGDGKLDFFAAEPPFQSGQGGDGSPTSDVPTRNVLYKGNGDGTFTYTGEMAGLEVGRNYGESGFFVDYNNDGKLDLFVKNMSTSMEPSVNVLYKNNGNGIFSQVPGAAGLETAIGGLVEGTVISFADYNNDGFMDVVMGGNGAPGALYKNVNGTFTDVTAAAGIDMRGNANGLAWGDYNNDGFLDLYISRGKQSGTGDIGNSLYRNNGDGTFTEVTIAAGVNDNTNTWAAVWGDYDNDGFLDLFIARPGADMLGEGNANILYHNNGNGTFTDVADAEGVAIETDDLNQSHKLAAWGDYDNDGFLDLVVQDGIAPTKITGDAATGIHYLFHNNGNSNHFIKVNLKGTLSNLNGIGARVTVTYTGGLAFRENNGGGGGEYASQGAGPLHFGIGSATVATVKVNWPNGVVDTRSTVVAGSTITITENESGGPTPTPTPSITPTVTPTPTPTPTPIPTVPPGKLLNISTRVQAQTGDRVVIGGFIITGGTKTKKVLVRTLGPSLADANPPVTGVLADPFLELHLPDGTVVSNNNWRIRQEEQILATGLEPPNDLEAAIVADLSPVDPNVPGSGQYTAIVSGHDGGSGVVLVEVYDLDDAGTAPAQLANISTRGFVGTDDDVMIGGFIIAQEDQDGQVLIRALGPSLSSPALTDALVDPTLEVHNSSGMVIATNNDWKESNQAGIEATGLAPTKDKESAVLATLPAGGYTAVVRGVGGASGVALVEIYRLQ